MSETMTEGEIIKNLLNRVAELERVVNLLLPRVMVNQSSPPYEPIPYYLNPNFKMPVSS